MQFQLEYRDARGTLRRVPLPPSRGLALLDALPPDCEARVISPNGQIWSIAKARAALEQAVGSMGMPLDRPLPGFELPDD